MKKLMLLFAFFAVMGMQIYAQKTITGTVTDDGGGVLPGVSVTVKGTTQGTMTGNDGTYSIEVASDAAALVFSFVGMATQEVEITGDVINAVMKVGDTELEELVVTAIGVTREEKSLGYAIDNVEGDAITQARESNVANSLHGRIAGAQITSTSGAVGASTRIVLRGAASLTGNNQPLFVVDGVPIDNRSFSTTSDGRYGGVNRGSGMNDINPNDVKSISVLKGPNAAALYGSRASNGVILITTKTGENSKGFGVSFSSTAMFDQPLRLPDYQNTFGQGSGGQFSFLDGTGSGTNDGTDESWGPKLDIGLKIPQFDSPVKNGVREATPWVSHPNNIADFFELGQTYTNNVAVSGGNKNANFRLSFTNRNSSGMVPNTDYKQNNLSFSGNVSTNKFLKVSANVNYVNANSDNQPGVGYDAQNVMQQFVWFGRQIDIANLKEYTNADGSKNSWNYNYHNNPYFTLYENTNTLNRDRFYGNAKADIKFTDYLKLMLRTGGDFYTNLNTSRTAMGDIDNPNGSYNEMYRKFSEVNSDFLLMFNKSFGSIDFNLNFGGNRMEQLYSNSFVSADELSIPGVYSVENSKVPVNPSEYRHAKRINSLYFSGQVAYNKYLYLDFTGRNDWSSTLPENNNSYFYPSVALSAVVTEMLGLKSNVLNFAKLRGSFAKVGSDADPYKLFPTIVFGDGWNDATKLPNTYIPNELPNAALAPEFNQSIEFGTDMRFFGNRLSLDFTYYMSEQTEQILAAPISGATGYTTKVVNAGKITNNGIEVLLGVTPIKMKNGFTWDLSFTFAQNINEVVSLADGVDQLEVGRYWSLYVMHMPNERYGALYGYDLLRNGDGDVIYRDGLPVQGDLKVLGSYTPDFNAGIKSTMSFKGISFEVLVDGQKGGSIYSMTNSWGRYSGVLKETLIGREGGVVGEGVKEVFDANGKVTGYVPNDVVVSAEAMNHTAFSNDIASTSVFDASYIKLREVKLGYTLPNINSIPVKNINIAVVGRNLALLYSTVPHIDPETGFTNSNLQGIEFGQLPSARSIGFSLSFNF